jgi:hypothetical protein
VGGRVAGNRPDDKVSDEPVVEIRSKLVFRLSDVVTDSGVDGSDQSLVVKLRKVPADVICDSLRNGDLDVVFDVPAHGPGNVADHSPDNKLDDRVSFELAARPLWPLIWRLAMKPDFGVGERLGVRPCLSLCRSLVLRPHVGLWLSLSVRLGVVPGLKLRELAENGPQARPVEGTVDKPSPGPPPGWNYACRCPFWPLR